MPGSLKSTEEKYRKYLKKSAPCIVRLDAIGATKSHAHELSESDRETDGFYLALQKTAEKLALKHHCLAFCGADEITLAFKTPPVKYHKKLSTDRVASVIGQEACLIFNAYFAGRLFVLFDVRTFTVSESEISFCISQRRKSCFNTQIAYIAKEYLSWDERKEKKRDELLQLLKRKGVNLNEYALNGKIFIWGCPPQTPTRD